MDAHLVQIIDLVKDYAKIIDDLREENEDLYAKLENWEILADKLIGFAELIRHIEGNDTRNAAYYNAAGEAIEQYKKLKEK